MNNITHLHILSILSSEIRTNKNAHIKIVDMGCGDGHLLLYLQSSLSEKFSDKIIEVVGFDVSDSLVQTQHFFQNTIEFLKTHSSNINWEERLTLLNSTSKWPYEPSSIDYVISNQVFEHVWNHDFVMSQINQVLVNEGRSFHLFPIKECFWEGHLYLPFAHWISNFDALKAYIKLCSGLGIGKYKIHKSKVPTVTLDEYSTAHADYILKYTNYKTKREFYKLAKKNDLRISFRYTNNFYFSKLKQVLGIKQLGEYETNRTGIINTVLFFFSKRVSSSTLSLEKSNSYSIYQNQYGNL